MKWTTSISGFAINPTLWGNHNFVLSEKKIQCVVYLQCNYKAAFFSDQNRLIGLWALAMLQDGSIQKCMYTSRKVASPHGNLKESVLPFILKNRCWLVTLTYSSSDSVAVLEFNDAGSLTDHRLCAALSTLGLLALTSTFQCLEMRQANHVVMRLFCVIFATGVLRCKSWYMMQTSLLFWSNRLQLSHK